MTYGFFIYAIANFIFFIALMAMTPEQQTGGDPSNFVWRGFSGHWMLFYSAGLATLTTAYRRGISNLAPKCRNGHAVVVGDKFCPKCGAPISQP